MALLLFATATPSLAASTTACDGYQPKHGENLWTLAATYRGNPMVYKTAVEAANPQIDWAMRSRTDSRFRDGREIVRIYNSDCLHGLTPTGALQPLVGTSGGMSTNAVNTPTADYSWLWWLLAAVAVIAVYAAWVNRNLQKDPITSGPAMRKNGLTDETAGQHFRERAAAEAGLTREAARNFTVEKLVRGRGYGVMNVRYNDNTEAPRRLDGTQVVYEAVVRNIRTGDRTTQYTLMACANDIRATGLSRFVTDGAFRFEPGDVIAPDVANATVETAAPVAVETSANPDAAPAAAMEEQGLAPGEVHVFFQPATGDKPHQLEMKGVDTDRNITAKVDPEKGHFILRFHTPNPVTA